MVSKRQRIYVVPPNKYGFGDFMNRLAGNPENGKYTTGLFKGMSTTNAAAINAATGLAGNLGGTLIGEGLESGAGNVIGGLSKVASAIPGPWGAIAGAGLGLVGGLVNRMFGSKLNKENINAVEANIKNMNNFQSNAGDFDTLTETTLSQPAGMNFGKSFIGKDGWFSHKASNKFKKLQEEQKAAKEFIADSINNNLGNILTSQSQDLAANFAAAGGPLTLTGNKVMSPFGKRFNEGGKLGGPLHSYGTDWTNGLVFINNGDTHERNANEGVQMGVDEQGIPNLVEEGEVIWNDYVFSNRLKVPKGVKKKYKLGGPLNMTFADAVKYAQKESEERPNDPISQRGLEDILIKLATEQEWKRQRTSKRNMYAEGGELMSGLVNEFKRGGRKGRSYKAPAPKGVTSSNWANRYLPGPDLPELFLRDMSDEDFLKMLKAAGIKDTGKYTKDSSGRQDFYKLLESEHTTKPYSKVVDAYLDTYRNSSRYKWPDTYKDEFPGYSAINTLNFPGGLYVGSPVTGKAEALNPQVADYIRNLYKFNSEDLGKAKGMNRGLYDYLLHQMFAGDAPEQYKNNPERLISDAGLAENRHLYNSIMRAYGEPVLDSNKKPIYDEVNGKQYQRFNKGFFRQLTDSGVSYPSDIKSGYKEDASGHGMYLDGEYVNNKSATLGINPSIDIDKLKIKGLGERGIDLNNLGKDNTDIYDDNAKGNWLANLRYFPVLTSGLNVFTDLMGWTNKPNYRNADMALDAARGVKDVKFTPIGDYMPYTPFDRDYYINKLNAKSQAGIRNLLNTSGGNRGAAMSGILASDYNTNENLGQIARQGEEFNLGMLQKAKDFNRATNMFNSEGFLKAQQANQSGAEVRMRAAQTSAQLRDAADARASAGISANLTNFADSVRDIGTEAFAMNMANSNRAMYYTIGSDGTIRYKSAFHNLSPEMQYLYKQQAQNDAKTVLKRAARGGYLTIRR